MTFRRVLATSALACALSCVIALVAEVASAQQIVVAEVTYEHSATTTSDSHLRLDALPGTPANLRAPIDYASGTAYVRLEVFTKPSDAGTRFQVCFEASPTYACTDQAPTYTEVGVYTWATPFSSFYQGDMVDWSLGLGRVALILKDTMNRKPSPENVGEEVSRLYMPTQLRVTVTLVPPGETYVAPADGVDGGMIAEDAGQADAGALDAGTLDAAIGRDASAPRDGGDGADAGGASAAAMGGCSASGRRARGDTAIPLLLVVIACAGARRLYRARAA